MPALAPVVEIVVSDIRPADCSPTLSLGLRTRDL
jgi:hypothetical protein